MERVTESWWETKTEADKGRETEAEGQPEDVKGKTKAQGGDREIGENSEDEVLEKAKTIGLSGC